MKDAGAAPETHAVTAPQARNLLKLAALATMTVDHVGAVFFPHAYILRIIGRLAFPFFARSLMLLSSALASPRSGFL